MLLARDGHEVTVLERDPAEPPPAAQAWDGWERRGVNQFRLPHFMLPRWWAQMRAGTAGRAGRAAWPPVVCGSTPLGVLPESLRGPLRAGDERFDTVTARRPVLEAALAAVAGRTPGVTIRRGVAVTGLSDRLRGPRCAAGHRRADRGRSGDPRPISSSTAAAGARRSAPGWRRPAPGARRGARGLRLRLLRPALPSPYRRAARGAGRLLIQNYDSVVGPHAARRQRHLERRLHDQQPGPGAARPARSGRHWTRRWPATRSPRTGATASRSPVSTSWPASRTATAASSSTASRSPPASSRSATPGRAPTRRSAAAPRSA